MFQKVSKASKKKFPKFFETHRKLLNFVKEVEKLEE